MNDEQIESTEYVAVWTALVRFSYLDGRPVDPHERNLTGDLLQLAAKYNSNGHWVASQLTRLFSQVTAMPLTTPERPAWFLATIEARLQRQIRAGALNLATAPSPEARRILGDLMSHTTLEIAPEERQAREFERLADGNQFQAFQNCVAGIKSATPLEAQLRLEAMLWMLKEGWNREFPRKAPVVEFGQQTEGKKRA